jgi:hypothetical protein
MYTKNNGPSRVDRIRLHEYSGGNERRGRKERKKERKKEGRKEGKKGKEGKEKIALKEKGKREKCK